MKQVGKKNNLWICAQIWWWPNSRKKGPFPPSPNSLFLWVRNISTKVIIGFWFCFSKSSDGQYWTSPLLSEYMLKIIHPAELKLYCQNLGRRESHHSFNKQEPTKEKGIGVSCPLGTAQMNTYLCFCWADRLDSPLGNLL